MVRKHPPRTSLPLWRTSSFEHLRAVQSRRAQPHSPATSTMDSSTLLSIEIQLDVMRRRLPTAPDQAVSGLASLQQTVRNEGAELRQIVTDLRPLRDRAPTWST